MFKQDTDENQLIDKVVHINRVAKVVKGGRRFSFSAIVVVGDGEGSVGFGLGKAGEVPEAIRKGLEKAKKSMVNVPLINDTIPYEVVGKFGAGTCAFKAGLPGDRRHCGRGPSGRYSKPSVCRTFSPSAWGPTILIIWSKRRSRASDSFRVVNR